MPDQNYKVISNLSELSSAVVAPPNRELVVLPEVQVPDPQKSGKTVPAAVWEYELDTGEHGDFDISDKVFDEAGNITQIKRGGRDVAFLAFTTRDGDGVRIFQTIEQAEATLKRWGKRATGRMLLAAQKANYGDGNSSADEAQASAEKNSGETSTSS